MFLGMLAVLYLEGITSLIVNPVRSGALNEGPWFVFTCLLIVRSNPTPSVFWLANPPLSFVANLSPLLKHHHILHFYISLSAGKEVKERYTQRREHKRISNDVFHWILFFSLNHYQGEYRRVLLSFEKYGIREMD
jgi:hypothetical protein